MAEAYDFETRENAADLYIIEGLTYEQVSQKTGVSVTQLKTWGADERWREKRLEYRESQKEIKANMVKLRKQLAMKAVQSLDPQDIYAFVRLENVAGKQERKSDEGLKIDRPALFLEDIEFIASYLKEKDPEGLKILARSFDGIIDQFKARHESTA